MNDFHMPCAYHVITASLVTGKDPFARARTCVKRLMCVVQ